MSSVSFARSKQASHITVVVFLYRCRLRTCNLMMISSPWKSSNRPSWSTTRIVRSITYNERKLNDLCRPFRYLRSWWPARWKFMYHVNGLIIALVITHSMRIIFIFDDIYMMTDMSDSCNCDGSSMIRWKSQQRFNIVRFGEIDLINALHCIVIGMNSQWVLFILFAKRFLCHNIIRIKFARLRNLFMSRISYDPLGMTISLSSSSK